jgi:hemoglobin
MVSNAAFRYRAAAVGITAPIIRDVIHSFYDKVRRDAVLAPIFEPAIGRHWDHHIEKVYLFWLTATRLGSGYAARNFLPAHMRHRSIGVVELSRWLSLFEETLHERCPPEMSEVLLDIANRMAENIQLGIARREELKA